MSRSARRASVIDRRWFLLGWVIFNKYQGDRWKMSIGSPYGSLFFPFSLLCNQQIENRTKWLCENGFVTTTTVC